MQISIVAAMGRSGQLGLAGQLPWHVPQDLKKFKSLTKNHHILMGRKTFASFPKPLPQRTHLVLTRSTERPAAHPQVHYFAAVEQALTFAREKGEKELFVVGGAEIYRKMWPMIHRLYLSHIHYDGKADTYFPKWNQQEFQRVQSEKIEGPEPSLSFDFEVWQRIPDKTRQAQQ